MAMGTSPGTASKPSLAQFITSVNQKWDLDIPRHETKDSPAKRDRRSAGEQCSSLIMFLYWQDYQSLVSAIDCFDNVLVESNMSWINKPRQEPGMLPSVDDNKPRFADQLRVAVLLRDHLESAKKESQQRKSRSSIVRPHRQPTMPPSPSVGGIGRRRLLGFKETASSTLMEPETAVTHEVPSGTNHHGPARTSLKIQIVDK